MTDPEPCPYRSRCEEEAEGPGAWASARVRNDCAVCPLPTEEEVYVAAVARGETGVAEVFAARLAYDEEEVTERTRRGLEEWRRRKRS